jgi:peptide/nickel transport system substrate-binding protein
MAAAVRYAYDPAKAKALLAEAGYPNGFTTQMVGFRSAQWTAAIQNDLAAVGIKAQVSMVEGAVLVEKTKKGEAPVAHWDWGSLSVNDASAVLPNFFGDEGYDRAQDKEVKALLDKAGSSVDQAERKALYAQAIKLITERAYSVPLHTFTINYAYNRELDFKAYPDELPRFYQYGWK